MKTKLLQKKEVNVKYLLVDAGVRYWDDSSFNGVTDTENGTNAPFKEGDRWIVLIDVDKGKIIGWKQGMTADIHYKICDDGHYTCLDVNKEDICGIETYVPSILCPKDNGYGDYIIMDIDENGIIKDWNANKIHALVEEINKSVLDEYDN